MKPSLGAGLALAMALTACGGSTSDDETSGTTSPGEVTGRGPATVIGTGSSATRITYDAAADELIVESIPFDADVFTGRYTRTPGLDHGAFQAYTSTDGVDTYVAYYDASASGGVAAAVINSNEFTDHGYSGSMYARNGTVVLPSAGQKASYSGDYIGLRTNDGTTTMDTITGDADLAADFSDMTIRGRISNRVIVVSETGAAVGNDLVLVDGAINRENATFSGTVEEATGGLDATGTYEGVIGGTNGSEVAGVLVITSGDLKEVGGFVATE